MRIAIPKGHLFWSVMDLLSKAGLTFTFTGERDYNPVSSDPNLKAKLVRPQAIPQLITLGNFQAGFCGLDLLRESGCEDEVEPLLDLRLSVVRLVVAAPSDNADILQRPPQ